MLAEGVSIELGNMLLDAKGVVTWGVLIEKILLEVTVIDPLSVEVKMAGLNDGVGITCTAQTAGVRRSKCCRFDVHSGCLGLGAG